MESGDESRDLPLKTDLMLYGRKIPRIITLHH